MYLRSKRQQAKALNEVFERMVYFHNDDIDKGDMRMREHTVYSMMGLQSAYMALDIKFQAHHSLDGKIESYDSNGEHIKIKED